eukprot:TRINITY_DN1104_c0_g1_i1.p1 TRINITY_DN1104_c0_g1~~TRINITY_DN1104_c0_g1_i1.p1  ORF type:complete len:209 (-),score=44.24 TRINITY_DN1104_c0_g1_i1:61-660(-)
MAGVAERIAEHEREKEERIKMLRRKNAEVPEDKEFPMNTEKVEEKRERTEKAERKPKVESTQFADDPGNGPRLAKNLIDTVMQYLDKENFQQVIDTISNVFQAVPAVQNTLQNAQRVYAKSFGEDMRPFYIVSGIVGLLFFFFILSPLLFVLKFGVFGFLCFSSHYTLTNSVVAKNKSLEPVANLGLIVLVAYLFKYLI